MTGESKIVSLYACFVALFEHCLFFIFCKLYFLLQVRKDSKEPFLMSGCKVADGNGTMLVKI